jgi:hypothetical protein
MDLDPRSDEAVVVVVVATLSDVVPRQAKGCGPLI